MSPSIPVPFSMNRSVNHSANPPTLTMRPIIQRMLSKRWTNTIKKAGSEDVTHSRNISADMKYVLLRFPGKKFQVQLTWVAADKKHGTLIQLVQRP